MQWQAETDQVAGRRSETMTKLGAFACHRSQFPTRGVARTCASVRRLAALRLCLCRDRSTGS